MRSLTSVSLMLVNVAFVYSSQDSAIVALDAGHNPQHLPCQIE